MWRTGRTPPWAPALVGALLLLLATPLWSQQDGGMDFDQVTGGAPPPALHKYQARDGTEPLAYSYRLQTSMHPRDDYGTDIAALNAPTLVLAGSADSSFNSDAYAPLFREHTDHAEVKVLEGVGHLGLIKSADTRGAIQQWLTGPVRRD